MDASQNNKKIAINTLIVYFRLFTSIIIGLITSRFVLMALGASDYGLYIVVGGVITMFSFISGALSSTTTRFLNYERGKPNGDTNRIFNISNTLHILCSILILIICETIGTFYILNYLNVAPGKEVDAMFVFQVSTVVACLGIINVPYQSLFVVHEKFLTIAIVDIINLFLKLAIVILLISYKGNALRFYAAGMSVMTFLSFAVYHYLAKKKWKELIKWKFVRDLKSYKEILTFNNYTLLGTGAIIARDYGSNILINYFFGTVTNAAYAIAYTITNYVNIFVGNFDSASAPQIIQNISSNNMKRALYLVNHVCRMCVLLMEIAYFPLIIEMDIVLYLWLGDNVPAEASVLCQYTLLVAIVSSTSAGIFQLIYGLGKVKWFKIEICLLYCICLMGGYLAYKYSYPAYTIIILFVISDAVSRIIQMFLLKYYINFSILTFIKEAYYRPALVFIIMESYLICYNKIGICGNIYKGVGIISTFFITCLVVLLFGLKSNERLLLFSKSKSLLVKIRSYSLFRS